MKTEPSPTGHAETLARLSADEMVSALKLATAPAFAQAAARAAFLRASVPLAQVLARFDARIAALGVTRAAADALGDLSATCRRVGHAPPPTGPLLVVANHPGAYDTIALLSAIGRDDVAIIASDRAFLRALPALARHLFLVPDGESASACHGRARGLLGARRHLAAGHAVLHFGAGRIEPDPAFYSPADGEILAPWSRGTGALVRGAAAVGGSITLALVEGVHSAAAKRLWVTRFAERRGVTTLATILQVAVRRYRRVDVAIRFAPADEVVHPARAEAFGDRYALVTARLRDRARALLVNSLRSANERTAATATRR